ncbi:unnamed protein product [Dibothriocephalus latus]|uniref:Uncharacterized protein n=1 Tax=Dibothriocephalus latus TaxID=60516 RepID=A0A3P7MHN6_DIBLA|nr:unnamed protein product [Dibothriocephalus latus]
MNVPADYLLMRNPCIMDSSTSVDPVKQLSRRLLGSSPTQILLLLSPTAALLWSLNWPPSSPVPEQCLSQRCTCEGVRPRFSNQRLPCSADSSRRLNFGES